MKRRALVWLATRLGPRLIRLWFSTLRLRWSGGAYLNPDPHTRQSTIFAFWHQRLLCFTYTHAGYNGRVLISRSRDGDVIAGMLARLGFVPIRGSSQRAGGAALRALLDQAKNGCDIGITPDGPRGPRHVFKLGAVFLASRSGLPIVPITVSYRRFWQFQSWDRFQLPWPFTRAIVHVGAPVQVPADLGEVGLETWRARLEQDLLVHSRDTDARFAELYRQGRSRRTL
jgi:lysophospholipid acyltransferase (LPLAT)-like uncharacterized protein